MFNTVESVFHRVTHVVSVQTFACSSGVHTYGKLVKPVAVWEEVVIDAAVIGTCLK